MGSYSLARLRAGLKPFRLHWYSRLRSTNDQAALLRRRKRLYAPAAVVASRQVGGRGRGKNVWWSGTGDQVATVTFALPVREGLAAQELPLIAGLAVRHAAAELTGEGDVQIKWPNDVWHDGLKLAGLLCERIDGADLVGIGLNVNLDPASAPAEISGKLTSLWCIAGKRFDLTEVVVTVARHLHQMARRRMEQPFSEFVREIEKYHALTGKRVTITGTEDEEIIRGRCEGIDRLGRLIVQQRGTPRHIVAGTVALGGE